MEMGLRQKIPGQKTWSPRCESFVQRLQSEWTTRTAGHLTFRQPSKNRFLARCCGPPGLGVPQEIGGNRIPGFETNGTLPCANKRESACIVWYTIWSKGNGCWKESMTNSKSDDRVIGPSHDLVIG